MKISELIDNIASQINIDDVTSRVITKENFADHAVSAYSLSLPDDESEAYKECNKI